MLLCLFLPALNQEEAIETDGLSPSDLEQVHFLNISVSIEVDMDNHHYLCIIYQILKQKVQYGLTLERKVIENNDDRAIPVDIVEAHKYVQYRDDVF